MADTVTSKGSYTAEKCKQKDSLENMIGIRSIMIEQETLFKEQVQALHRLYKVQKVEMQNLKNKKTHLTLETAELTDGFSIISQLEEKSGALIRPVARVYKPETGSLSLHPFCSLKLFEGSLSASCVGSYQQQLVGSQSKKVKKFDLERFPESYPTSEESEIASVEGSHMSNDVSEDGLITATSSKVVSSETEGNQDSIAANPMDTKTKWFHQGSFASVNGCPNSSSSECEENNSDIAVPCKAETIAGASDIRASSNESSKPRKRRRRHDTVDTEAGM